MKKINKNSLIKNITFSISAIVILIITYTYMKNTKTIYFWDNAGYWENSMRLSDLLKSEPKLWIEEILSSILFLDHTYLPAIIPTIGMSIFSKSRMTYTIINTIIYAIPVIYLFLDIENKLLKNNDTKSKIILNILIVLMSAPLLLSLNFEGYVDIGGLIIVLLTIKLYFFELEDKKNKKYILKLIFIGILLITSFFFRRWYIYWIISFLVACIVYDVVKIIKTEKEKTKIELIEFLKKYLIIGISILSIALLTIALYYFKFRNNNIKDFYLYKLLFYNYSYAYTAYQRGIIYEILNFLNHIGLINIIIATITIIYLNIRKEKNKTENKIVNILFMQMIICFILFEKVQTHEVHHLLLYLPGIAIINTIGIKNLLEDKPQIAKILIVIFMVNIILLLPFFNECKPIIKLKNYGLLIDFDFKPAVREDIDELQKIDEYIEELSENSTKRIFINSSSTTLNSSIITYFEKSLNINYNSKPYLIPICDVDKRDGVPLQIFYADIVVVTNPDQIHLDANEQKIVSYINKLFINNEGIAKNFEIINKMKLDDMEVCFYRKNKEIYSSEKEQFYIKCNEIINE